MPPRCHSQRGRHGGRYARLPSIGCNRSIRRCGRHRHGHGPTLVYLALPSGLLEAALTALAAADLGNEDAVAIEKPFGTDLASAQRLNALLASGLSAPTIFRIDHFLSDELVRRVVGLALCQPGL